MDKPKIPEINPFIIGAGGVCSYLLPVLVRTFPIPNMWLRDADILEERNLDRQLFTYDQIGQAKASALLELPGMPRIPGNNNRSSDIKGLDSHHDNTSSDADPYGTVSLDEGAGVRSRPSHSKPKTNWQAQVAWFTEGELPPSKADLVICVADNHTARRAALNAAETADIPCVIGGNEYYDSQAMYVDPMDFHTKVCPFKRYPELLTDTSADPVSCQGKEQEVHPQLAIANMRCASHILDLLWLYLVVLPGVAEGHYHSVKDTWPVEIFTSVNNTEYYRHA